MYSCSLDVNTRQQTYNGGCQRTLHDRGAASPWIYKGLSKGLEMKRRSKAREGGYSRGQAGEMQSSDVVMYRKRYRTQ